MTTELMKDYGDRLLPYLIQAAQRRETPTYGELAEKIEIHHRTMNRVLEYIRDDICMPRGLPMLTAIVINQGTGLPGDNWLPQGTTTLSDEEYRQQFEQFRDRVFAYKGWDDLLKALDLEPVRAEIEDLDERGRAYADYIKRSGGSGEGEDHLRLKEFIAVHPNAVGLQPAGPAIIEYAFIAGDEADIVFELAENKWAVVEIKNGDTGELVKGIYQAIKYRALLQAEKGHGNTCQVDAILVAYQIPSEISLFAAKFGLRCRIIHYEKAVDV